MRSRLVCLGAMFGVALAATVEAASLSGEYYNEFHFKYETPCTRWAKPLAGGPVKAFIIAPTHTAREVTELAQRLDLTVSGETSISSSELGDESTYNSMIRGTSSEEKKLAILTKLSAATYDVIVLANYPLAKLPIEIQFEILKRVKEGNAGLLLAYRREAPEQLWRHPVPETTALLGEVPLAGLTFYKETYLKAAKLTALDQAAGKLVQGFRVGKGRVALLDYGVQSSGGFAGGFCLTPFEPFTFRTFTEYDYHHSLVAKAVLWAAKREPAVAFDGLPLAGLKLTAAAANTVPVTLRNSTSAALSGTLEIRVRNEWGEIELEQKQEPTLAPGTQQVSLSVPPLPGGTHFLDLTFRSARGVEGWASAALLVEGVARIAKVEFGALSFAPTEPCPGTLSLAAACPGDGWQLDLTLLDNYGRRFHQQQVAVPAGATAVPFSLPLNSSVSLVGRLRATLLSNGSAIDQAEGEFFVRQPQNEHFPALVWGNLPCIFGQFTATELHAAGFDSVLHYYGNDTGEGRPPATIARQDFHAIPYVTRIDWKDGRLGKFAEDQGAAKFLRDRTTESKPYAPLVYSLGDENYIDDNGGFHANEQPAFQAFVQERYGDIAKLNAAWDTTYGSFAEATPVRVQDAKGPGGFVRFHDTESFREKLYADWHRICRKIIREVDPEARVGAEGSVPGELELTVEGLEFWGPYRSLEYNTLLRSLAPRALVRGNWFGGYNGGRYDTSGLPRFLWESMLDGSTLLEVYCSYTCENFYTSDLSWAPWMDSFLPGVKEVTNGLGQFLALSAHDTDPVAVYHSQASVHFEQLSRPFGGYDDAHRAALRLLEDLSFVPYYVTSRQVERGVLEQKPPRVLVLPHATALSDAEVAAIDRFVRAGGVLMADVRPGIADGRCRPRDRGALDDMLGVPKRDPVLGQAELVAVSTAQPQGAATPETRPKTTVDASVLQQDAIAAATGAAKAGTVPLCGVRKHGAGTVVLLNFSLSAIAPPSPDGKVDPLFGLVQACLAPVGLQPAWHLTAPDGTPLRGGRVAAFARNGVRIAGFMPPKRGDGKKPVPAVVQLAAKSHVYNLREGRYLGCTDRVELELQYTQATFLSALPYQADAVQITAPAALAQGQACPVRVGLTTKGAATPKPTPLFRVNVAGPDGVDRHYYARTLAPAGPDAECAIPLARNDPSGTWTITARDIATGTQATAQVKLEVPR